MSSPCVARAAAPRRPAGSAPSRAPCPSDRRRAPATGRRADRGRRAAFVVGKKSWIAASLGHDELRPGEVRLARREAQHLAARRVLARQEVEPVVRPRTRPDDLVGQVGKRVHLPEASRSSASTHRHHRSARWRARSLPPLLVVELHLVRWECPCRSAYLSLLVRRTELVEVDLLEEAHVLSRALPGPRVPGVSRTLAVAGPREAAARGAAVRERDGVARLLAGRHVVDATCRSRCRLRQGDSHLLAVAATGRTSRWSCALSGR